MLVQISRAFGDIVVAVAITLLLAYVPLRMAQDIAPAATLLFVAVGTAYARRRRATATLAITGLVLYGASWLVAARWGYWAGVPFWTNGILGWFTAMYLSLPRRFRMSRAAV